MLRLIINLNRCLNTIYGIQAQDNDHNKVWRAADVAKLLQTFKEQEILNSLLKS